MRLIIDYGMRGRPRFLARPERLELPTYWFEASRSIHLSYGRATTSILAAPTLPPPPGSPTPQALPPAPPLRRRASASVAACVQTPRPPACRSKLYPPAPA